MDYRQLQAFTVLAEELHFGRAAQRLHITQPALTQQIKSFENALELRLFTRDRRNVALTAEGQFLLAEARMILGHCDKFRENARSLRQGRKGQLKIGYVGSAIFDPALSVLIGNYRQRKPEADLLIEEHNVNDLITGLLSETVDLAFIRSPGAQYDELESLDIATRPLVAVVPRHHPLASRRAIPLAALAEETFFIQQDPCGVGLGWSAISACRQAGFTPRKIQYSRDVSMAIGQVSMGMGVTLVPETQSAMLVSEVSYCLLEETFAVTTLTLCWRRESRNGLLGDFIAGARELLAVKGKRARCGPVAN
ncbi:LysR substrate-binding domain-containing protein [Klebsiella aerogenes]|nr:LysR family transcriptional regulator [Klebsiella aerogenes]HBY9524003.1 LysR family transcriptional regulator [Klebsiella aerogenes]